MAKTIKRIFKSQAGKIAIGASVILTISLVTVGVLTGFFIPAGNALAARTVMSVNLNGVAMSSGNSIIVGGGWSNNFCTN
ncbi:MAG: hypothetical protein NTW11_01230 [Candidatus Staskawiczbacteria bacterium]|nr:hypothetical protein [Candidatus Staskawiczbacteria bacterium]